MKVGFLFLHKFSESLGSATRVIEIAKTLNDKGYETIIYAPYESKEKINGIKISHLNLFGFLSFFFRKTYPVIKRVYYGKRTRKITAYKIFDENFLYNKIAKKLSKTLLEDKIDILIAEQDFSLYPAIKAVKDLEIPIIGDLHNITAEELVAAKILKEDSKEFNHMQIKLAELLEKIDAVVAVSEELKQYVIENYSFHKKIVTVPPSGRPRINDIPEREKPLKLIYSGMLEYREGLELFIESLKYINEQLHDYKLYLTRKGSELKKIRKKLKEVGVNAHFYWFNVRNDLYEHMKKCHVGILTSSRNKARILGPPIKLLDYMSVALPVVANDIGGWSSIIRTEKVGVLTGNDPKSYAEGILELIENEDLYWRYAKNAINLVKNKLNWNITIKPLEELIRTL